MVEINILYKGELRCTATHQPSGMKLLTDAPKDNHGKGESFSPTDLVATALGTCMMTLMGIAARTLQIDLSGTRVTVHKEMATKPIRRIATLIVTIDVPLKLDETQKKTLIDAAMTCPVHASLRPDVKMPVDFRWA
jgi:putative redox protein